MKILDTWGEGRIVDNISDTVFVTGFTDADKINKDDQKISNGPDAGKEIPRLIPVKDYDYPIFPLAEDLSPCEPLMGAPITVGAAQEMCRVFTANRMARCTSMTLPNPSGRRLKQLHTRTGYSLKDAIHLKNSRLR